MCSSYDPTRATLFTIRCRTIVERRCVDAVKTSVKVGDSAGEVTESLFEIYLANLFVERITTILFVGGAWARTRVTTFRKRLAASAPEVEIPYIPEPILRDAIPRQRAIESYFMHSLLVPRRSPRKINRPPYLRRLAALFTIFTEGKWENNNNDCARRRGKKRRWIKYCF